MRYPLVKPVLPEECYDNLEECIDTGWVSSQGGFVSRVEILLAAKLQQDYALATSSGTTALHLALKAIDIKPGDEVIVPNLTFIAPVNAILHCGATPVFVDSCNKYMWNIDASQIPSKITSKTKAILAVHIYGIPCNITNIKTLCDQCGLWLIEDAAEALGGACWGDPVGSFGDISIVSFFANKNITSGEGGMVFTNHPILRDTMQQLRDHGVDSRCPPYYHSMLGYNYRMTNLQAAVLEPQIKMLGEIIKTKAKIFEYYDKCLGDNIIKASIPQYFKAGWWLYSALLKEEGWNGPTDGSYRDSVIRRLKEKGIESRPFFRPAHTMPYVLNTERYPVSTYLSKTGINLPSYIQLSEEDIEEICEVVIGNV